MKRNLRILFFLLIIADVTTAQINDEYFQRLSSGGGAYASVNYNSNALTNGFIQTFFKGGYIDSTLKNDVASKLRRTNTIGYDIVMQAWGLAKLDTFLGSQHYALQAGIQHVNHFDMRFSGDLFRLAFYGNKMFAGQTANAGNFSLNQLQYQKFTLGYYKQTERYGRLLNESFTVSFIKGQQQMAIKAPTFSIFTEAEGRHVDLQLQYEFLSSDTAKTGYTAYNGWGVAADYFTEIPVGDCDKMRFEFSDLGFIVWNNNAMHVKADTGFVFSGMNIENIFTWQDSINTGISGDSLLNKYSSGVLYQGYTISLPTWVHAVYTKNFNDRVMLKVGGMMRFFANYNPLLYAKFEYYATPNLCLHWRFAHGGYGKLTFGMGAEAQLGKHLVMSLGTQQVEGLISQTSSGFSAYGGLKYYLK